MKNNEKCEIETLREEDISELKRSHLWDNENYVGFRV
jgi:hypothetical protein